MGFFCKHERTTNCQFLCPRKTVHPFRTASFALPSSPGHRATAGGGPRGWLQRSEAAQGVCPAGETGTSRKRVLMVLGPPAIAGRPGEYWFVVLVLEPAVGMTWFHGVSWRHMQGHVYEMMCVCFRYPSRGTVAKMLGGLLFERLGVRLHWMLNLDPKSFNIPHWRKVTRH